jgi:hypothetical protein
VFEFGLGLFARAALVAGLAGLRLALVTDLAGLRLALVTDLAGLRLALVAGLLVLRLALLASLVVLLGALVAGLVVLGIAENAVLADAISSRRCRRRRRRTGRGNEEARTGNERYERRALQKIHAC